MKEQELNSLQFEKKHIDYSMQNTKDLLQGSMQNVNRELKKLEEDALPERSKGTQNPKSNVKNDVICTKVSILKCLFKFILSLFQSIFISILFIHIR